MQTIQFKVNDNALQTILSILQSLKQGMIQDRNKGDKIKGTGYLIYNV
jgi:hypothetical protein